MATFSSTAVASAHSSSSPTNLSGLESSRVEIDDSHDRMQKKIRNAQVQKVPFMVIAGDRDMEEGAVSFRYRNGDQDNGVPVDEAVQRVVDAVAKRVQV